MTGFQKCCSAHVRIYNMKNDKVLISRNRYRFALIDDEVFYHPQMKEMLREFFPESELDCFFSIDELMESEEQYSLLIVDVMLNGKNAITLSRVLSEKAPFIMYYSAARENLRMAFGYNVIGFILKTDSHSEIRRQFVRIEKQYLEDKIMLRTMSGLTEMKLTRIVYIEKEGRKIFAYSPDQSRIQILDSLKEIQEKTKGKMIYANRSVLINTDHIRSIKDNYVFLANGRTVDISRRLKKVVEAAIVGRFQ